MTGKYDSPNFPTECPGTPALQLMSQAEARQEAHNDWHKCHPGEWECPPEFNNPDDYADIERGQNLMGAMTFSPGDAFVSGRGE